MKKFFTLIAVAALAFAAQANELTVAEGLSYTNTYPICGLYADTEGTMTQSIYGADMLTVMAGNKITAVKFYTLAYYYESYGYVSDDETDYINFDGAKFQLALKEIDETGYTDIVAYTGATAVATCVPEYGDIEVEFVLDQPFEYTGKNLLVEVTCIETEGDWGQTYFFGMGMDYNCSYYFIPGGDSGIDGCDISKHLPMATFTYEAGSVPPTVQADAPEIGVTYGTEGNHVAYVNINTGEQNATIYYSYDGENWMEYEGELLFTENGTYIVYAYVSVPGKLDSEVNAVQFVVTPRTGMTDVMSGKTIANQRYFNLAGQEMQEANGLTIVVTTYTDGTTNAVKVVK